MSCWHWCPQSVPGLEVFPAPSLFCWESRGVLLIPLLWKSLLPACVLTLFTAGSVSPSLLDSWPPRTDQEILNFRLFRIQGINVQVLQNSFRLLHLVGIWMILQILKNQKNSTNCQTKCSGWCWKGNTGEWRQRCDYRKEVLYWEWFWHSWVIPFIITKRKMVRLKYIFSS